MAAALSLTIRRLSLRRGDVNLAQTDDRLILICCKPFNTLGGVRGVIVLNGRGYGLFWVHCLEWQVNV
ncbi:hypothetical protein AKJ16_DCAP15822 [Drosera capensis]